MMTKRTRKSTVRQIRTISPLYPYIDVSVDVNVVPFTGRVVFDSTTEVSVTLEIDDAVVVVVTIVSLNFSDTVLLSSFGSSVASTVELSDDSVPLFSSTIGVLVAVVVVVSTTATVVDVVVSSLVQFEYRASSLMMNDVF